MKLNILLLVTLLKCLQKAFFIPVVYFRFLFSCKVECHYEGFASVLFNCFGIDKRGPYLQLSCGSNIETNILVDILTFMKLRNALSDRALI